MKIASHSDPLTVRINFLRTVPLFVGLTDDALGLLAADFSPIEYVKNEMLFWQGDSGAEFYIVRRGKVRIYKISAAGRETSINIFSTGNFLGEFAAIDGQVRSATAQAITNCLIWRMDGAAFLRHLQTMPGLLMRFTCLLVEKLRWTAEFAETVAQYDAAGRLLHLLLLYNQQYGESREASRCYTLELGLNQDNLASLVGARREWVNRLLQSWQREGWMEYRAGKIIIHDLARMEQARDGHLIGDVGQLAA